MRKTTNLKLGKPRYAGKTIAALGVGGSGLFYIAKYLLLCGAQVYGYDIAPSERTNTLSSLEAHVSLHNPSFPLHPVPDLIVYSSALPKTILREIENQHEPKIEVGQMYSTITGDFEHGRLTEREQRACITSEMVPLCQIDTSNMTLIGVTGTDGKTTTCAMIAHILEKSGYRVGMISTLSARIAGKVVETGLHTTTPTAQELSSILKDMITADCTHIIIEATSQGLAMGRLAGLKFDAAVFTNITDDHRTYHKTWQNYAKAKALLITQNLKPDGFVVLNRDDIRAYNYLKPLADNTIEYSTKHLKKADALSAQAIRQNGGYLRFTYRDTEYSLPTIGRFNVSNALAAAAALKPLGIPVEKSLSKLSDYHPVSGRMELIQQSPFTVIVDYAHTPNGLLVALKTARKSVAKGKQLILVFGCASQRDDEKRPTMGAIARKFADVTILTAEDCRMETLQTINDQIEAGWNSIKTPANHQLFRFDDDTHDVEVRRSAIMKALSMARRGDLVLITGKGHEQSLCFGTIEYPWNDIDETKRLLHKLYRKPNEHTDSPKFDMHKTYVSFIRNAVDSKLFRDVWISSDGKPHNVTRHGKMSCAVFVSNILLLFGLVELGHATVDRTIDDMTAHGWILTRRRHVGCVLVWEDQPVHGVEHKHIGFYVGKDKAVSNSFRKRTPIIHHWTYGTRNGQPIRKIIAMYWHEKLETGY